jgi:hypothetical protein
MHHPTWRKPGSKRMLPPDTRRFAVLVALLSFQSACGTNTPADAGDASSGGSSGSGGSGSDAGGTGSGSSSGSSSEGGSPDATAPSNLAKTCMVDTDCGGGLTCLKATDTTLAGGGPAHGYCSLPCTGNSTCAPYGGTCANVAPADAGALQGQCLLSCSYGILDLNKCRGRSDLGCSSAGLCVPVCGQDTDCPAARKCDFATGVCADTLTTGGQLGSYCMNSSMCAGTCITVNGTAGGTGHVCSTLCVLGRVDGCNFTAGALDAGSGVHGSCRFSPRLSAAGDVGHCAEQCATTADCLDTTDPGTYCRNVTGSGYCSWSASDAGADAAPAVQDAGQDAAGTDAGPD